MNTYYCSLHPRYTTIIILFDSINREKMEQILLVYSLPKDTITATMMLNKNTKATVRSPDDDTNFLNIVALKSKDALGLTLNYI